MNDEQIIKEARAIFFHSASTYIADLNKALIKLEKSETSSSERLELTDKVLRIIHTLKGDAACVGLSEIERFTHILESSMKEQLLDTGFPLGEKFYNVWFEAVDVISEMIEHYSSAKEDTVDISRVVTKIRKLTKSSRKTVKKDTPTKKEPPVTTSPLPTEEQESHIHLIDDQKYVRMPVKRLDSIAEGVSSLFAFRLQLEQQIQQLRTEYRQLHGDDADLEKQLRQVLAYLRHIQDSKLIASSAYNDLTVMLGTIEKQNQQRKVMSRSHISSMQKIYREVRQTGITIKSQDEEINKLRMTTVANLFSSFHRYVRDTTKKMKKEVLFNTKGENIELDRTIIEQLREPLIHLIRNALDHGLESAEERKKKNKNIQGLITLKAFTRGNHVVIEVEDDGRGLDADLIKKQALEKELLTPERSKIATKQEIYSLIFESGFSTKQKTSLISGRGVGMAVVRNCIENLRGRIELDSENDRGTTVRMMLPLSLATMQVLIIEIEGSNFAIPLSAVDRVITIPISEIKSIESKPAIFIDGSPIELYYLNEILSIPHNNSNNQNTVSVVISRGTDKTRGWVVDKLLGEQEIVVKNFTEYLNNIPHFIGAAMIASDRLILVLNTNDLHKEHIQQTDYQRIASDSKIIKTRKILVVDDSLSTRTLEKLILIKAGYDVIEAVDGVEAYELMLKSEVDLVISDIQMPRMDGITLTKKIRQSAKLKDMPIILISFLDKEEDKKAGMQAGANIYITKQQFSQQHLINYIEQYIGD